MAARNRETAVNQGWAKEPLRRQDPRQSGQAISQGGLQVVFRRRRMRWPGCALEQHKCQRCPEPANLHKVYVEYVAFAGEVIRRSKVGRVEVGRDTGCERRYWRGTGDGRKDRVGRSQREDHRIEEQ